MTKEYMAIGMSDDPDNFISQNKKKLIINPEFELNHYGIIGMKWGQKRIQKAAVKAATARINRDPNAKKYTAKEQKLRSKFNKTYRDPNLREYVKKESTKKAVGKSLVFGTYGAMKYDAARANGATKGKAALKGTLAMFGNAAVGGAMQGVGGITNRHRK